MNTPNERFPRDAQYVPTSPVAIGGFWENLEMIRPVAWVIALIVFIGMECIFWFAMIQDKMHGAPLIAKAAVTLIPLIPAGYVLLVGYVYVDSKRRGMRYVMWTLLAIFINNFIGIILYFLLRDPLPTPCPKCGHQARGGFSFCPKCGTEILRACNTCHKKLEIGWVRCAYCGAPVGGQEVKGG
jgi:hypothetical protein